MNLSKPNVHLSDEAMDGLLIGEACEADEHHVAACEFCSSRLADFRGSLASFNQASAAWSVARSNTISRELTAGKPTHSMTAAWSLASFAVLAVAVSLTGHLHRSPDPGGRGAHEAETVLQQSTDRQQLNQQDLTNDNAMLVAIDSELSQPVPSPVGGDREGWSAGRHAVEGEVRE